MVRVRTQGIHYVNKCPHKGRGTSMFVCVSEWVDGGAGGWRVLMGLDPYVIGNEMRQICSSPVL